MAFGLTNREISQALGVGADTVKKHLYRTMLKLGLERRTQLAVSWMTGRRIALGHGGWASDGGVSDPDGRF